MKRFKRINKEHQLFKRWDKIIIIILLLISFLPYILLKGILGESNGQVYAQISVDGALYKKIPLTGQVGRKTVMIETEKGKNTVVIENEQIAVTSADCRDQLCTQFGWKHKVGDVIVCLPHAVYIELVGQSDVSRSNKENKENEENEEIDIIAY